MRKLSQRIFRKLNWLGWTIAVLLSRRRRMILGVESSFMKKFMKLSRKMRAFLLSKLSMLDKAFRSTISMDIWLKRLWPTLSTSPSLPKEISTFQDMGRVSTTSKIDLEEIQNYQKLVKNMQKLFQKYWMNSSQTNRKDRTWLSLQVLLKEQYKQLS